MADYPQSNTARYRFIYSNSGGQHKCTLRIGETEGAEAQARSTLANIFAALQSWLPASFAEVGCEYVAKDSDIAQPRPKLDMTLVLAQQDIGGVEVAHQFRFEGRAIGTVGGILVASKVNFSLHGLRVDPPSTFRWYTAEWEAAATVVAALNNSVGEGANVALAVNGFKATWYEYVNFNYNSHYERKWRS